jgi:hypothetical protein
MAIDWNKLISVEVLSTSAVLVFSVGVAYTTLANGQEQADAQITSTASQTSARCKTQYLISKETLRFSMRIKSIS